MYLKLVQPFSPQQKPEMPLNMEMSLHSIDVDNRLTTVGTNKLAYIVLLILLYNLFTS